MKQSWIRTSTTDGVTLSLKRVNAEGKRRGAVVCLHAMMTDGRYFGARREDSFANTLAATGLDVYVADFRGHGDSVPPHARGGDWSFDDLVERDLPTILTTAANASECDPSELRIIGHSLGGLVTCAALGTGAITPPKQLVLAATSVWLGGSLRRKAIMGVYRGVTKLVGYAPIRALRVGTADESKRYVAQLTGWSRSGRWTSLTGVDYQAALANITTPTFAFVGAGDWMCRPRDAEAITGRIRTSEALRIVGRTQGDALDPDHFELFTRSELKPLWREVASQLG